MAVKKTDDAPVEKRRPDPTPPPELEVSWPKGATPYLVDGVRVTHGEYVAFKRVLRKQEALRLLSGDSEPPPADEATPTPEAAEEA